MDARGQPSVRAPQSRIREDTDWIRRSASQGSKAQAEERASPGRARRRGQRNGTPPYPLAYVTAGSLTTQPSNSPLSSAAPRSPPASQRVGDGMDEPPSATPRMSHADTSFAAPRPILRPARPPTAAAHERNRGGGSASSALRSMTSSLADSQTEDTEDESWEVGFDFTERPAEPATGSFASDELARGVGKSRASEAKASAATAAEEEEGDEEDWDVEIFDDAGSGSNDTPVTIRRTGLFALPSEARPKHAQRSLLDQLESGEMGEQRADDALWPSDPFASIMQNGARRRRSLRGTFPDWVASLAKEISDTANIAGAARNAGSFWGRASSDGPVAMFESSVCQAENQFNSPRDQKFAGAQILESAFVRLRKDMSKSSLGFDRSIVPVMERCATMVCMLGDDLMRAENEAGGSRRQLSSITETLRTDMEMKNRAIQLMLSLRRCIGSIVLQIQRQSRLVNPSLWQRAGQAPISLTDSLFVVRAELDVHLALSGIVKRKRCASALNTLMTVARRCESELRNLKQQTKKRSFLRFGRRVSGKQATRSSITDSECSSLCVRAVCAVALCTRTYSPVTVSKFETLNAKNVLVDTEDDESNDPFDRASEEHSAEYFATHILEGAAVGSSGVRPSIDAAAEFSVDVPGLPPDAVDDDDEEGDDEEDDIITALKSFFQPTGFSRDWLFRQLPLLSPTSLLYARAAFVCAMVHLQPTPYLEDADFGEGAVGQDVSSPTASEAPDIDRRSSNLSRLSARAGHRDSSTPRRASSIFGAIGQQDAIQGLADEDVPWTIQYDVAAIQVAESLLLDAVALLRRLHVRHPLDFPAAQDRGALDGEEERYSPLISRFGFEVLRTFSTSLKAAGKARCAARVLEASTEVLRAQRRHKKEAVVLRDLLILCASCGESERAIQHCQTILRNAIEQEDVNEVGFLTELLVPMQVEMGHFQDALRHLNTVLRFLERIGYDLEKPRKLSSSSGKTNSLKLAGDIVHAGRDLVFGSRDMRLSADGGHSPHRTSSGMGSRGGGGSKGLASKALLESLLFRKALVLLSLMRPAEATEVLLVLLQYLGPGRRPGNSADTLHYKRDCVLSWLAKAQYKLGRYSTSLWVLEAIREQRAAHGERATTPTAPAGAGQQQARPTPQRRSSKPLFRMGAGFSRHMMGVSIGDLDSCLLRFATGDNYDLAELESRAYLKQKRFKEALTILAPALAAVEGVVGHSVQDAAREAVEELGRLHMLRGKIQREAAKHPSRITWPILLIGDVSGTTRQRRSSRLSGEAGDIIGLDAPPKDEASGTSGNAERLSAPARHFRRYRCAADLVWDSLRWYQRGFECFQAVGDSVHAAKAAAAIAKVHLDGLFVPVKVRGIPLSSAGLLPRMPVFGTSVAAGSHVFDSQVDLPSLADRDAEHQDERGGRRGSRTLSRAESLSPRQLTVDEAEYCAKFALEKALDVSDPWLLLKSYLCMAEVLMLREEKTQAISYWWEARDLFLKLFADGANLPAMRYRSNALHSKFATVLEQLLRFLMTLERPLINQNLLLLDLHAIFEVDVLRGEREINRSAAFIPHDVLDGAVRVGLGEPSRPPPGRSKSRGAKRGHHTRSSISTAGGGPSFDMTQTVSTATDSSFDDMEQSSTRSPPPDATMSESGDPSQAAGSGEGGPNPNSLDGHNVMDLLFYFPRSKPKSREAIQRDRDQQRGPWRLGGPPAKRSSLGAASDPNLELSFNEDDAHYNTLPPRVRGKSDGQARQPATPRWVSIFQEPKRSATADRGGADQEAPSELPSLQKEHRNRTSLSEEVPGSMHPRGSVSSASSADRASLGRLSSAETVGLAVDNAAVQRAYECLRRFSYASKAHATGRYTLDELKEKNRSALRELSDVMEAYRAKMNQPAAAELSFDRAMTSAAELDARAGFEGGAGPATRALRNLVYVLKVGDQVFAYSPYRGRRTIQRMGDQDAACNVAPTSRASGGEPDAVSPSRRHRRGSRNAGIPRSESIEGEGEVLLSAEVITELKALMLSKTLPNGNLRMPDPSLPVELQPPGPGRWSSPAWTKLASKGFRPLVALLETVWSERYIDDMLEGPLSSVWIDGLLDSSASSLPSTPRSALTNIARVLSGGQRSDPYVEGTSPENQQQAMQMVVSTDLAPLPIEHFLPPNVPTARCVSLLSLLSSLRADPTRLRRTRGTNDLEPPSPTASAAGRPRASVGSEALIPRLACVAWSQAMLADLREDDRELAVSRRLDQLGKVLEEAVDSQASRRRSAEGGFDYERARAVQARYTHGKASEASSHLNLPFGTAASSHARSMTTSEAIWDKVGAVGRSAGSESLVKKAPKPLTSNAVIAAAASAIMEDVDRLPLATAPTATWPSHCGAMSKNRRPFVSFRKDKVSREFMTYDVDSSASEEDLLRWVDSRRSSVTPVVMLFNLEDLCSLSDALLRLLANDSHISFIFVPASIAGRFARELYRMRNLFDAQQRQLSALETGDDGAAERHMRSLKQRFRRMLESSPEDLSWYDLIQSVAAHFRKSYGVPIVVYNL